MILKCEICNKEFNSVQSLSNHIARGHKRSIQNYYDEFILKNNEDKCLECGKKTTFINYRLGYHRFCCIKCAENNNKIKDKILKTNIEKYDGIGFASKELRDKSLETYNLKNNTNLTNFGTVAWDEETRKKRNKTIKENGKLSKAIKEIWKNRTTKDIEQIVNNTKNTKKTVYGNPNYNNVKQSIETKIKKYGRVNGFNPKKHISYDGFIFDSTLELDFYKIIKSLDKLKIVKTQLKYNYIYDNKKWTYNPDFMITYNDKQYIVETKGLHFFKNHDKTQRMINPYIKKTDPLKQYKDDKVEAKHLCMLENKVYIITDITEISAFLEYIDYKEQEFPVITTTLNI